jgi:hypothetical protein
MHRQRSVGRRAGIAIFYGSCSRLHRQTTPVGDFLTNWLVAALEMVVAEMICNSAVMFIGLVW